jgi:hypothetical protein
MTKSTVCRILRASVSREHRSGASNQQSGMREQKGEKIGLE